MQVRRLPSAAGQRSPLQLVCLCNKPSQEFLALQELHESHLTLIEGSAFSERDLLQRAALAGSAGAIVLADRCGVVCRVKAGLICVVLLVSRQLVCCNNSSVEAGLICVCTA